jgi:rubrerythrin
VEHDTENDLGLLRALMARELETINHYRSLAEGAAEGEARDFFLHIIEEEKLHVADVLRAIAQMDPDQASVLAVGYKAGHAPGEIPGERASPEDTQEASLPRSIPPSRERSAVASPLTIGSLRRLPQ